jgi:hypothetical protein
VSDCKSMKCYVLLILGTAKSQPEITLLAAVAH